MLSFESELEGLRPALGDARTDALIARDRREVFSLYPELRLAAWAGAMLLASAAAVVLKKYLDLDRIGPAVPAVLIALAAAACYAWVWWRRAHASIADDFVLLLGALLVSADVAYAEQQFHLLDHAWPRHFLILAVVHGVGAYLYRSRMLLSLSITALAAWLGVERQHDFFARDIAPRFYLAAAAVLAWRQLHVAVTRRVIPSHGPRVILSHGPRVILSREDGEGSPFLRVFEHFAANLALCGGIAAETDLGYLVTIALAALVIFWGFRQRDEPFVLYGFAYAVLAADASLLQHIRGRSEMIVLLSMVTAIVVLIALHKRFHERRT